MDRPESIAATKSINCDTFPKYLPYVRETHKGAGNDELDDAAEDGVRQPVVQITPGLRDKIIAWGRNF